jgi:hypothetical protein
MIDTPDDITSILDPADLVQREARDEILRLRAALANEREACAKDAQGPTDQMYGPTHGAWERGYKHGRIDAASAIRARKDET